MVNPVALCVVALSFFAVTEGAHGPQDVHRRTPSVISGKINLDLGNPQDDSKVAAAWWASWHAELLPLDKISWKKYTHITYAFA